MPSIDIPDDSISTLAGLIREIPIAMLTTVDEGGGLHSRPMVTQQMEFDGDLWFFTGRSTHKSDDISKRPQVNLSYVSSADHRYVSVSGTATLVQDRAMARKLWHPSFKTWFPAGVDDPELTLLKIRPDRVEHWDSRTSSMMRIFGFVKTKPADNTAAMGPDKG